MRFVLIGLAIVLFGLVSACSQLALTRSPESATETQEQSAQATEPAVELAEDQPTESSTEAQSELSPQLIEDLKSVLHAETGVAADEVVSVSTEAVEWPDACLGVSSADELCAQVITPGYRVVLHTLDSHYEFHTDRSGENIKLKTEEQRTED